MRKNKQQKKDISVDMPFLFYRQLFSVKQCVVCRINNKLVKTSIFFCSIKADFNSKSSYCVINSLVQEVRDKKSTVFFILQKIFLHVHIVCQKSNFYQKFCRKMQIVTFLFAV